MRKIFINIALATFIIVGVTTLPTYVSAAGGSTKRPTIPTVDCSGNDTNFLSFPTWYRGLKCEDADGDGVPDGGINIAPDKEVGAIVFTIALNIVDIMLRLIGILAVGFIIWGGVQYILARGEPEKAKKGLDTIIKAATGMVIAIVAATIVSFIVWSMGRT